MSEIPPPQPISPETVGSVEHGSRVPKQTETEMNLTHNKLRRIYYDYIKPGKPFSPVAEESYAKVPHLLPGRRIVIQHPPGYTDANGQVHPNGLHETAKIHADHREYLQHKTGGDMPIEEHMAIPKEERGLDKPRSHHDWLIFLEVDKQTSDAITTEIEQRSLATMGILDASWLTPEQKAEQTFTHTIILPEEPPEEEN